MPSKSLTRKKSASKAIPVGKSRQIAAGEFKAKCLGLIDEINQSGGELIITKRGKPAAKLIPFEAPQAKSFIGRLEGVIKINGDPDDLIKPVFPLDDWDMLK